MKTWKVKMTVATLVGTQVREFTLKAQTEASARKKAWQVAGNQSVENIEILPA